MVHPSALQAHRVELFEAYNTLFEIPKCVVSFDKWIGNPLKETFGVESKRNKKDKISGSQKNWFASGLKYCLFSDDFF